MYTTASRTSVPPNTSATGSYLGAASLSDLPVSQARSIVLLTALGLVASTVVVAGESPTTLMSTLFALAGAFALISWGAYRLLARRYATALIVWQGALLSLFVAGSLLLNQPELLLLAALLPLISASTLGGRYAIGAGVLVLAALLALQTSQGAMWLPGQEIARITVFGALAGAVGWSATTHMRTLTSWAIAGFESAHKNLEDAREQRVELLQVQEDLSRANVELVRLADRLARLQHVAEEARQAKVEFVSNVSHELRTPLNMIIGFAEIISTSPHLYGSRLPVSLLSDIAAIQRNSKHLLSLVNDVLDLSQVEAGQMALSREWATPARIVQEAVLVVRDLFDSKRLYLTPEVADDLPLVFCDQTRIRQVIINLLSNAGRFTTEGGVHIVCRLESHPGGDLLHFSVADTGLGIAPEVQARIFDPFQQADNSIRRTYEGSGLGLTISRNFIELHGGKMWLESALNVGTTFHFTLPLVTASDDEDALAPTTVQRGLIPGDDYGFSLRARPTRAQPLRILPRIVLLEEEQSLFRLLSRYLQDTEIVSTKTPAAALAELHRSPAQALIVNMPPLGDFGAGKGTENSTGMGTGTGAESVAGISMLAPVGTPVIYCWIPGEVEAAAQLGVLQYLMKPITREKLLATLEDVGSQMEGGIRRILVADDEPDQLHLFARMLESAPHKYEVLEAANGRRALDLMRGQRPDILLLDLMMPVMDAVQVLEEKRKEPDLAEIPVIIISSRDPLGEAITSNVIRLSHSGGFSTAHLLGIIQATAAILAPPETNAQHAS